MLTPTELSVILSRMYDYATEPGTQSSFCSLSVHIDDPEERRLLRQFTLDTQCTALGYDTAGHGVQGTSGVQGQTGVVDGA